MMLLKRLMKTKDAAPFLKTHVSSSSKTKDAAPFLKGSKELPDNGTSFAITSQFPDDGTSLGVDRPTNLEIGNLELVAAQLHNGYYDSAHDFAAHTHTHTNTHIHTHTHIHTYMHKYVRTYTYIRDMAWP